MKGEMYTKAETIQAPMAPKHDTLLEKHGDKRLDPYYWMKLTDGQKNAKYTGSTNQRCAGIPQC